MRIQPHNLRTPGPTPIPEDIYEAMSDPMINHRGPEFFDLITECTDMLKQVFMTENDLFILTSSGTGGLEASVVNTLSPVIGCWPPAPVPSATGSPICLTPTAPIPGV